MEHSKFTLRELSPVGWLLFFSLISALFWVVLRLGEESNLSLYLLFIPLCIFLLFSISPAWSLFAFLFMGFFFIYNFLLTVFYTDSYTFFFIYQYHFFKLFIFICVMHYFLSRYGVSFVAFVLNGVFLPLVLLAIIQWLLGVSFPNVNSSYEDGSVSSIFWNQNEFGVAMAASVPFVLIFNTKLIYKLALICVMLFLHFVNDSKLPMLATVVMILIYPYFLYLQKIQGKVARLFFKSFFLFASLFVAWFLFLSQEYEVGLRDYNVSFGEWVIAPISAIVTLEPIPGVGSMSARVNAVIFGFKELISSGFAGIGLGNSLVMLQKSEYFLPSAASMHNIPVQLAVELGVPVVILFLCLILVGAYRAFSGKGTEADALYILLIVVFFVGSLGSSVGIMSNFFFWFFVFSGCHVVCQKTGRKATESKCI